MKVYSDTKPETYVLSGNELRVHWAISEEPAQSMDGEARSQWAYNEAVCSAFAGRSEIISSVIRSVYSVDAEFALINNRQPAALESYQALRDTAKQLADTWLGVSTAEPVQMITVRQARLALLQAGLLDDIEAAIAASDDRALQIEWEFATEFRRDWPALTAMQPALGLSDTQVDALFATAATL